MKKLSISMTIRDQVLEQMRNIITSGEIKQGERLYEEKLAAEFGVSRTPVREALHVLEREGFLEAKPRVGYMVKVHLKEDFDEIIEIRKALESHTAILASQKLDNAVKEALEKNTNEIENIIKKDKIEAFMELNDTFHEIIDTASGNKRLCEMTKSLRGYMYFHMISDIIDKQMAKTALAEHKTIVKAMISKNENKIRKSVNKHLDGLHAHAIISLFSDTEESDTEQN